MLRLRTDVVKEVVTSYFTQENELEKRRIESTVLQIIAAIYAPPRSVTPIDVEKLLECVKETKTTIDTKEREMKLKSVNITEKGVNPYPISCQSPFRADTQSPIPVRLVRNESNEIVMTLPIPILRPTPRRAPTPLNPDIK